MAGTPNPSQYSLAQPGAGPYATNRANRAVKPAGEGAGAERDAGSRRDIGQRAAFGHELSLTDADSLAAPDGLQPLPEAE
jgi:hypothetical protein